MTMDRVWFGRLMRTRRFSAVWRVLLPVVLLFLSVGCRSGRYELSEPIKSQFIEVATDDRWQIVLDENLTTGYEWTATCADSLVDLSMGHREPESAEGLCGVPGKAVVTMHIRRGFAGPTEVTLRCRRNWSNETAREIVLVLYRKTGDHAPWKR